MSLAFPLIVDFSPYATKHFVRSFVCFFCFYPSIHTIIRNKLLVSVSCQNSMNSHTYTIQYTVYYKQLCIRLILSQTIDFRLIKLVRRLSETPKAEMSFLLRE